MNYAILDIWFNKEKNENFYKRIKSEKFDKIFLFAMHEPDYWTMLNFYPILEECEKQNKQLNIITSVEEYFNDIEPKNLNVTFEKWPTFWLNRTLGNLDLSRQFSNTTFKYPYIMMVNKAHLWRCQLLDLLGKHKLIHKGAVSWHQLPKFPYTWKYVRPRIMTLTDHYRRDMHHGKVPEEYFNSFVQLVSETSIDARWTTEKTITPLMLGKPFIVAASPYFHKMLKDWGIELYDELFDYSFDSVLDTEQRYDMLLENIKRICEYSPSELSVLYETVKDKIEFNKKKIFEITSDFNNFPATAKEVVDHYLKTGISLHAVTTSHYENLKKAKLFC
jgi:hypothetical protein